jgi:hypothetical protein
VIAVIVIVRIVSLPWFGSCWKDARINPIHRDLRTV